MRLAPYKLEELVYGRPRTVQSYLSGRDNEDGTVHASDL